jgi:uncharacterized metal-binding protein YceD (DUF177 family)
MNNFTVKLGAITNGKNSFSFQIKDQFFESFAFSDVDNGDISAVATINKDGKNMSLNLAIEGQINRLACDICTDDLSVKVSGETNVIIKKTDNDLVSTDEVFYVKKSKNIIDLRQLIFELIILNTPKKRQHTLDKEGKSTCNKEMLELVNRYTQVKEKTSDHRWDVLKSLK